jgi:ABC-2 type transport system ATP-binding protein
MNVLEASGLGKSYGSTWALRECSLAIPAGHVTALVGPNGSGKTTLLSLAAGLAVPSAGGVTVLAGRAPRSPVALEGIAFVAQDTPLYKNLSVEDMLHLTSNLNRRFDRSSAQARLAELGIPLKRKAGRLSGGQQAQLALTLALALATAAACARRADGDARSACPRRFHGDRDGGDGRRRRIGGAFFARAGGTRAGG